MRRHRAMVVFALLAASAQGLPASAGAAEEIAAPASARQRELFKLLKHDCGSCHGMRLTGGLGPALTPDALKDKVEANLTATILSGRPNTAMPPWQAFISEPEAAWLVSRMRKGVADAR